MEIRDKKLYKDVLRFDTFQAYCKERWDFTRRYAYLLIDSSAVIENVNNCSQKPITESQARPLTKLQPDQQREAWQKAVETAPEGKVTSAIVTKVVKDMTVEKPKPETKPKPGRGLEMDAESELKPDIPDHAIYFAMIAISQLERIASDNPSREKALSMVEDWINKNKKGE
jgi:hypothetical protein